MTSIDRRRALWAVLSRRAYSDPASYLSLIQRLSSDSAATTVLNNLIDALYGGQWAGALESLSTISNASSTSVAGS